MNDAGNLLKAIRENLHLGNRHCSAGDKAAAHRAYALVEQLKQRAIDEFGRLNGWRPTRNGFQPRKLGSTQGDYGAHGLDWRDHSLFYKRPEPSGRVRRNAALVGQPYGTPLSHAAELHDLERAGFQIHTPPMPYASIHYPGATLFIVVTLPGQEVRWLSEQVNEQQFARHDGAKQEAVNA